MGRLHHRRFLVPADRIRNGRVVFGPEQAHQLLHVLRLRRGDQLLIFDGTGRELLATLTEADPRRAEAVTVREVRSLAAPALRLTVAQVPPRGAAMDFILAKATELGATRIVPLEGRQGVRRGSTRNERWLRIIQEAAEQCGRSDVPDLRAPTTLSGFLASGDWEAPLLVCHPARDAQPLLLACEDFRGAPGLTLVLGGEGGLSPDEVEELERAGARLVSLGPRRLRAETATVAALAVLQASLGDWGTGPSESWTEGADLPERRP